MTNYARKALGILLLCLSLSAQSQIFINEFMASNSTIVADPDFGGYSDWIELYNSSGSSVSVAGYYVTDNISDTTVWQIPTGTTIPANGYLLLWADGLNTGLHTNFKLSKSGEEIALYTPSKELVDSLTYFDQVGDVSQGRKPDGSASWAFFNNPTAGTSNGSLGFNGISGTPDFSIPGGFYTANQEVSLSSTSGGLIRFTTDGTEPDESSPTYSAPITITANTVVRARLYEVGKLGGKVINQTYFINIPNHSMPVISISSDPQNFWNASTGFYVNYLEDWERPIGIEFYEPDGTLGFMENAGISIYGGATRGAAQKGMSINFRSVYGNNEIKYKLFETIDRNKFSSFLLRNGGNNWYSNPTEYSTFNPIFFGDAIQHTIVDGQMDLDYMAFRPAVVYINGNYWGILNIREKMNEDYTEAHHGANPDSLDFIKLVKNKPNEIIAGTSTHFENMVNYLKTNDMSQSAHYEYIKTQMDVGEFINYQITEMFMANYDWPDNNDKFWRPQSVDGKWRWMLYDLDFGLNGHAWGSWPPYTGYKYEIYKAALNTSFNEWSTVVLRELLKNEEFEQEFLKTFAFHLSTTFSPDRMNAIIDKVIAEVEDEMARHINRWGPSGGIATDTEWRMAIGRIKDFASLRAGYVWPQLLTLHDMDTLSLSVSTTPTGGGFVKLDGKPIHDENFTGVYFTGVNTSLEAVPYPGYEFEEWQVQRETKRPTVLFNKESAWKYLDDGSNQGTAWRGTGFNDFIWSSGNGKFGYNSQNNNTTISYGSDKDNKPITTYFRKTFTVTDAADYTSLKLKMHHDDGAVVYINGVEVKRIMLPTGTISYTTRANHDVYSAEEFVYNEYMVDVSTLVEGSNVIAVEIHQNEPANDDHGFDMALIAYKDVASVSSVETTKDLTYALQGNASFAAGFTALPKIFINEVCAFNQGVITDEQLKYADWIELYNPNSEPFDVGGLYISDNLNNPDKWMIPEGMPSQTTIPANGYLLLWADSDPEEGVNHVDFSLDRTGDEIGLFDVAYGRVAVIDTFSFAPLQEDQSYGRYPDGEALQVFDIATPLSENNDSIIPPMKPLINTIANQIIDLYDGDFTVSLSGIEDGDRYREQIITLSAASSNESVATVSVNYTSPAETASLVFTPKAVGTVNIMVTVKDDGSTAGAGENTTQLSFSLDVRDDFNQPPLVNKILDASFAEDGSLTLTLTGIADGDDGSQNLSISASLSHTNILQQPVVTFVNGSDEATLFFEALPNQYGLTTVTVFIADDGGNGSNNGNQTTEFDIEVNVLPVNDAPIFDAPADLSVAYNSGETSFMVTGIDDGEDDVEQELTITLEPENPTLIENWRVTLAGNQAEVFIVPASDVSGSTNIALVLKDDGGTLRNGVDELRTVFTFTIEESTAIGISPLVDMQLYPVPVHHELNVVLPISASRLFVIDMTGKIVQQVKLDEDLQNISLPVSHLQSGIYFVKAITGNKVVTGKFVKE